MAPGLVMIASLFGDIASAVGVILRFLDDDDERARPLSATGETSSSSATALRCGVDECDIV